MEYEPSTRHNWKHVTVNSDRILRGAKPAELLMVRPTILELVIYLKTARALGLTIAQSMLIRADEVIQ